MRSNIWRNCLCVLCSTGILSLSVLGQAAEAKAASLTLSLSQAASLAFMNSRAYTKVKSKMNLQRVKYTEAVKSIALKQKNKLTFRWSPLLSFKFPEKPDMAELYDWMYKPMQIQNSINALIHELNDVQYGVREEISNLYVTAYTTQEKIAFARNRLDHLNTSIERNEWKVKTGEASQADLDKMKASVNKVTTDLSLLMRQMETVKTKMSDTVGMDITTGFRFLDPYVKGNLERSMLAELTEHTLSADHGCYEASMNASMGLASVELNERILKSQYMKYMPRIQPYINQTRKGEQLDQDACKAAYDQFLQEIDSRWQGSYRILFIKIPKEWFKGTIDGVRFIEDDPYLLYTQILEYEDLRMELEDREKEVRTAVSDGFEALITARNAYDSLKQSVEKMEQELKKSLALNQEGTLTYDELKARQDEYEEYQVDLMDSLASYSSQLYSFDRLTCGGITKYLEEGSLSVNAAAGGDSYLAQEEGDGAYYYLLSRMEDHLFLLGISLPEGYEVEITDFELWVDGVQVGERTRIKEELRHLTLTVEDTQDVKIRFYNKEEFVDECAVNPMVRRGKLHIKGEYKAESFKGAKKAAGISYTIHPSTGTMSITIKPEPGEQIAYYQLTDKAGQQIFDKRLVPVEEPFQYLSLAAKDLGSLNVNFYDTEKNLLYTGEINPDTLVVAVQGQ